MLNSKLDKRDKQLQYMIDFTDKVRDEIKEIASTLNWTIESIENENENCLICPYDPSHRIVKESLNRHVESCQWKAEGYEEFDVPLSEPDSVANASSSMKFDAHLQSHILQQAKEQNPTMKIESYECCTWHGLDKYEFLTLIIGFGERLIPRTSNRLLTDFTCDERNALYEYVVSNTMKPDIGYDITDTHQPKSDNKKDRELSFVELLMQERNLKRRRAKHKGVHTNKKSHTEILREVINQQMELYCDYVTQIRGITCNTENSHNPRIQDSDTDSSETFKNMNRSRPESSTDIYIAPRDNHRSHSSKHSRNRKYEHTDEKYSRRFSDREKFDRHSSTGRDSGRKHSRQEYDHISHYQKERTSKKKDQQRFRNLDRKRDTYRSSESEKSNEHSRSSIDYWKDRDHRD